MEQILARPTTKQDANFIAELFDKMKIPYERKHKSSPAKKSINHIPNEVTKKAVEEARSGKGQRFVSLDDLFTELNKVN